MVCPSMDMGIHDVSIHGWAKVRCRTTSCLPAAVPTTIPAKIPMPSRLPN
jgi:hypothetical protein